MKITNRVLVHNEEVVYSMYLSRQIGGWVFGVRRRHYRYWEIVGLIVIECSNGYDCAQSTISHFTLY